MYYALFDKEGNRIASYHTDIHSNIPSDAIQITDDEQTLYATNEYVRGTDGKPQKKPLYTPTVDELLAVIRTKRNKLLADCDWTQLPDAPLTVEQKQAWSVYRQELRDFPETCDPYNPVWPAKPG